MLQPTSEEEAEMDVNEEELPPKVHKIMRNSLSMEQNDVINLAARLAQSLDPQDGDQPKKEKKPEDAKAAAERNDRLRKKVRTIARMARMFKTLRQENESVIRL